MTDDTDAKAAAAEEWWISEPACECDPDHLQKSFLAGAAWQREQKIEDSGEVFINAEFYDKVKAERDQLRTDLATALEALEVVAAAPVTELIFMRETVVRPALAELRRWK